MIFHFRKCSDTWHMWKLTQLIWPSFICSPTLTNTCLSHRLDKSILTNSNTEPYYYSEEKHKNKLRNVNLFVVVADSSLFFSLFYWMLHSNLEFNNSFLISIRHLTVWLVIWQYTFSHVTAYTYLYYLVLDCNV